MHRQRVDDVGPIVASLVAVAHEAGGDRVAVGLFPAEDVAKMSTSRRIQGVE